MASKRMSIFLIISLLISISQEIDYASESLKVHAFYRGKLSVVSKVTVNDRDDLSVAYTPGVAEPCKKIIPCIQIYHQRKNSGCSIRWYSCIRSW